MAQSTDSLIEDDRDPEESLLAHHEREIRAALGDIGVQGVIDIVFVAIVETTPATPLGAMGFLRTCVEKTASNCEDDDADSSD